MRWAGLNGRSAAGSKDAPEVDEECLGPLTGEDLAPAAQPADRGAASPHFGAGTPTLTGGTGRPFPRTVGLPDRVIRVTVWVCGRFHAAEVGL